MTDLALIAAAYDLAARRHVGQRRKGATAEPYMNHLTDVAHRVTQSDAADPTLLLAAVLHDVVEDTCRTPEERDALRAEIEGRFGAPVRALVDEVTDNKDLEKAERKRLQIETMPGKSAAAKRLKLADKASNLTALAESPPADWDAARRQAYVDWAERVVAGARGVDDALEAAFDAAAAKAREKLGVDA